MENARELFQIMTRRLGLLNKDCCSVGGINLSLAQSHLLHEVERRDNPSMQQVAETLGTDVTTFSRQVQSLIKLDLVKKTPDPDDRRVFTLSLTAEGKRVAATIDQQMNSYLEEAFSYMTEFEKETVLRSVQLFNEAMGKSSRCCAPVTG
ncbi:DNA-binding transcriptional regulator, MarR family [Paenibacillus sophorae]|uniref:DNA-binding transcriptional regulator, MarR family n=1 Tax=Paenibacillus sophorae TaxID=1333845 RepID=A0A1H8VMQ0_9BACL|nr:MarR family winged helix-turn-helix transcriptional regulator [Paenibacillus sophorae]QWU17579.1 MarR family winged helix-turn-helix transcriptional regulator [Paenibacillus sophorae]SEP16695.1 DNA-binding transcriptional regulator, MarR family [Paenibacillus sophorae]